MNNRDRASRLFEQSYDVNNLHVDMDKKRQKNIEKINKLIEKLKNKQEELYNKRSIEIHDVVRKQTIEKTTKVVKDGRTIIVKANVPITDKEKEELRDKIYIKYDKLVLNEIRNSRKEIEKEIKKQAKELLILTSDKDIYDYYCHMINNPLSDSRYATLESNIYREFLMDHPKIENIIISYSELEARKVVSDNSDKKDDDKSDKKNNNSDKKDDDSDKKDDESDKITLNKINDLINEAKKFVENNNIEEAKNIISKIKEEYNNLKSIELKKQVAKNLDELVDFIKEKQDANSKKDEQTAQKVRELLNIAKNSRKKEDFLAAKKLIDQIENEELKNKLIEEFKEAINYANEQNELISKAKKLVEQAEKEKTEESINIAKEAIEKIDNEEVKKILLDCLNAIKVKSNKAFIELFEKLCEKAYNEEIIEEDEITLLASLFQELDDLDASKYHSDVEQLIKYYNERKQDIEKENYDGSNSKIHPIKHFIYEIGGFIPVKIKTSKYFKNKRIEKYEELVDRYQSVYEKSEEKNNITKEDFVRKNVKLYNGKLLKDILDADIVSGVRLFKSRNAISKLKPRLYKNELTDKDSRKFERNQKLHDKKLGKGLYKVIKDEKIVDNKERIINVLDQFCELLSVTPRLEPASDMAFDSLEKYLSNEEIDGTIYLTYRELFNMIINYRKDNDNAIYEYSDKDITAVKNYYDSEEYEKQKYKLSYIKK